jgi:single-strand DNA-binding protein
MANFNKVLLMGNLTRDPEVRYSPKGMAIGKLGLAVNERYTTAEGEQKEFTTFVDVDVFGKQAETISQYLSKGSPIFIEGRLRLDTWDDKESGQKRSKLKVICDRFQFIGAPRGGGNAEFLEQPPSPGAGSAPRRPSASQPVEEPPAGDADDNIPF